MSERNIDITILLYNLEVIDEDTFLTNLGLINTYEPDTMPEA